MGDVGSIPGSGRFLEKEMTTHSSILAWRISWMEEPDRLQSTGLQRVGHDCATSLSFLLEHSLALTFFGIGMKLTFLSPVATAEFSKISGILSAALSQHHLLGLEIAQLAFYHLHYLCS